MTSSRDKDKNILTYGEREWFSLVTASSKMNNSKKIISSKIEMIKNGIVPAFNGHELVEMLESMTYEDRKIAKRKI